MKRGFINEEVAHEQALKLLYECSTPHGFLASKENKDNYKRIWGRDSMICSLAALTTGDKFLIMKVKESLQTLIKYQNKYGQIPSNVDPNSKKISYGGSAGRIDSNLWFLIGFGQYLKRTQDYKFLRKHYKKFKKTIELSHLYELNEKGFIYVPKGGDWADEFIMEGYVLYDQILYYQALKEYIYIRKKLKKNYHKQKNQLKKLKKSILINFWPEKKNKNSKYIYHKVLFTKIVEKSKYKKNYFLPYFNPSEYGFRFDGMANTLSLLFKIPPKKKQEKILNFINKNFSKKTNFIIPSFYPVITKKEYEWKELRNNYLIKFKNKPYQYHNGGLWPMITGFFASFLSRIDKNKTQKYLNGINYANFKKPQFSEYLNGKTFKPCGTKKMAWSAAAEIMAYNCLKGEKLIL